MIENRSTTSPRQRSIAADPVEHPSWTVAATMLASSLAFIDGSVVNVALPAIRQDLHGDAASLPWAINAYLLPLSALLLLGGAAGDQYGRRRVLIGGIVLFTLASVGCALASGLDVLFAWRAVQGVGAALLMPNSLGILGSSFTGEARGRAVGTWAAAGAIASAVGPPLGGWLVDTVGWQAIFYLNVPIALAAIAAARRYVAESVAAEGRLDWLGAILATAALGVLAWALTLWSSRQAASVATSAGLALGVVLFALFVWAERWRGGGAMMPLTLFASRPFVGLTALTFLLYGALGGLLVLLPYLLIVGGGYSPLRAGLALLPFPVVIGGASRLTGQLGGRVGPRLLLTVGPIVSGVGYLLLMRADAMGDYWTGIFPGIVVVALGMAFAVAPLTTAVLSSVDGGHTGTASGLNSAVARTGGLMATALAGSVIGAQGAALTQAFDTAASIGGGVAIVAGLIALVTLET